MGIVCPSHNIIRDLHAYLFVNIVLTYSVSLSFDKITMDMKKINFIKHGNLLYDIHHLPDRVQISNLNWFLFLFHMNLQHVWINISRISYNICPQIERRGLTDFQPLSTLTK